MPSPELILRHAYGYWASAILAAGIKQDVFGHLESGPLTVDELADRASISRRSAQALLDALLGLELIRKQSERYANSNDASIYLVPGKPDYLGGYANMILATWRDWERFPDAVASGKPLHMQENYNPNNRFWEELVPAIAPLAFIPARATAERLKIASRPSFHALDIAGGAGAYTAIWLGLNAHGRCTQIDWPNVNVIAKRYVATFGVADRFDTIDGDMEQVELASACYDIVIYSSVAHGLPADRNIAMFKKIRSALKPDGVLVIVGLIPNDDRTGSPLLLMFNANMLLNTEHGSTHVRSRYTDWLHEAGFSKVDFEALSEMPFTVVYAS